MTWVAECYFTWWRSRRRKTCSSSRLFRSAWPNVARRGRGSAKAMNQLQFVLTLKSDSRASSRSCLFLQGKFARTLAIRGKCEGCEGVHRSAPGKHRGMKGAMMVKN